MGRKILFVNNQPVVDVDITEKALSRKFKKGDKVRIKELCKVHYPEDPIKYCDCKKSDKYRRECGTIGIVEDTEEAGSNYEGIPKYGLKKEDGDWLGDYLETEIEKVDLN